MAKTKLQLSMEVLESAFKSNTFDPSYCLQVMERASESEAIAKKAKQRVQILLELHFKETVAGLYKNKNSDTGTVSQFVGKDSDHEIVAERKKTVTWDQAHLSNLISIESPVAGLIVVETKHTIPEKDYQKISDEQKEVIDVGRTVKASATSYKIKVRDQK
mgnify:FL=1